MKERVRERERERGNVEARIVKSVINFMLQLSIIAHRDQRLRDNERAITR